MHHLVTGGAGFLGYHLVRRILDNDEGARVTIVDDMSTPGSYTRAEQLTAIEPRRVTVQAQDLRDYVRAGLERHVCQQVWHLASPASPPLYKGRPLDTLRLGGEVLDGLLSALGETGGRLLFASTSEVYGDAMPEGPLHPLPMHESDPGRVHCDGPRSMYDEAKRYGEALCAAYRGVGVDARVVRIFNTYGPFQSRLDGRLVPRLLHSAVSGIPFPLHGTGRQTRTFAYVDDTVSGILAVARAEAYPGTTNVGSDRDGERSVLDLVDLVRSIPGARPFDIAALPAQDEHDPRRRLPDLTRLRSLGWEPTVSLREGLERTFTWMKRQSRG